MAVVKLAYRFALDPTAAQTRALRSHAGAARFAWNWVLARCKERYAAERKWYSGTDLHRLWNAAKKADPALAWWGENSKCCYQESFRNLDRALRDFVKSKKGAQESPLLGVGCQEGDRRADRVHRRVNAGVEVGAEHRQAVLGVDDPGVGGLVHGHAQAAR